MPGTEPPVLCGVVLAGGESSRMGTAKANIRYRGEPEVCRTARLLQRFCNTVTISLRDSRVESVANPDFPVLFDDTGFGGPLAGILTAMRRDPECAQLVVACDMPLLDETVIETLVGARDPRSAATVCMAADGAPEPLCGIYEPRAREEIESFVADGGRSPRAYLMNTNVRHISLPDPDRVASANTPAERKRATALLRESAGADQ